MDKIIDFNELKNKVNDKDIDKFESYIYSLYYDMSSGKLNMSDFTKNMMEYMEENNISQDKFLKMQTKLMERYGFDASAIEEQIKSLGLNNMIPGSGDIEKVRKTMSFQEKYKDRIKVTTVNNYFIKNDKNNVGILTEGENVILKSSGKIDLNDLELNDFLCSYKKVIDDNTLKISICEDVKEYEY
ncbi:MULTISPECIES: DUF3867 domain-containing protein [Clostridium]|jgi:hypothetical protein|uniref:DUF3867 domain-containing protein n=1 Tax=Clostridium TaxID=1485 RepID=UPI001AE13662|nr:MULTISPECIES: DUF3867 domain-containing protein [Clostridium]MBP1866672.1 hypothetical protein [Clostridium tertium]MBS5885280.1 DUF3867 domain-containing protein [Clostridium sp.]MDU7149137.1 DUF3867 domain-containing protein [Clostridium sp.]MDU7242792.1 DUF3867 domain-containing protein [Clostridium sp.]